METNKVLIVAILFAGVLYSGLYWKNQAEDTQALLVDGSAYSAEYAILVDTIEPNILQFTVDESEASDDRLSVPATCPGADLSVPTILKYGDKGEGVRDLQKFLAWYYDLIPKDRKKLVTGTFDLNTQNLLKNFQRDNHLPETGVVDQRTAPDSSYNSTYYAIRLTMDMHCGPRINSINPQTAQRGDVVTINGSNFTTKSPQTIKIRQVGNWPPSKIQSYKIETTAESRSRLTFVVPADARATGNRSKRFIVRIDTMHGNSNEKSMNVYVEEYDHGVGVPTPTATPQGGGQTALICSSIGGAKECTSHSNPICEWYNNACKLPSCGGLSVFTNKSDPAKYEVGCFVNGAPGGWQFLGPTDDCGWREGSTRYGCFYRSAVGGPGVPTPTNSPSGQPTPRPGDPKFPPQE